MLICREKLYKRGGQTDSKPVDKYLLFGPQRDWKFMLLFPFSQFGRTDSKSVYQYSLLAPQKAFDVTLKFNQRGPL